MLRKHQSRALEIEKRKGNVVDQAEDRMGELEDSAGWNNPTRMKIQVMAVMRLASVGSYIGCLVASW